MISLSPIEAVARGWELTPGTFREGLIWAAGLLVAAETIRRLAFMPVIRFFKRIEASVSFTESQMKNNGGSTPVDKIDKLIKRTRRIERHLGIEDEEDDDAAA